MSAAACSGRMRFRPGMEIERQTTSNSGADGPRMKEPKVRTLGKDQRAPTGGLTVRTSVHYLES